VDFPGLDVCPYGTAAAWIAADAPHSAYKAAAAVAPLSKRLYFAHKSAKPMVCRGCYTFTPANAFHRSCSTQLGGEPLTVNLFAVTSGVVASGLVAGWKAQSEAEAQAADAVREAALAAGLAEIAELKAQLEAAKGAQPAPKAPDQAAAALGVAALANSKAAEAEGAGAPGGGMAGWGGGAQAGATGTGTGSDTGVLDAVTRGGSEARSVVAQLVTLRGELEPMAEPVFQTTPAEERGSEVGASLARVNAWGLRFLRSVPQGTTLLSKFESEVGVPAATVSYLALRQGLNGLDQIIKSVNGWIEEAAKVDGGIKPVSLFVDMGLLDVGQVVMSGTKEFIRLPGSDHGVPLGKAKGGTAMDTRALVLRLGIPGSVTSREGVVDHLARQALSVTHLPGHLPPTTWVAETTLRIQCGQVPSLSGALPGNVTMTGHRWQQALDAYAAFVRVNHCDEDGLREELPALVGEAKEELGAHGVTLVDSVWTTAAQEFNVKTVGRLGGVTTAVMAKEYADVVRALPRVSLRQLFKDRMQLGVFRRDAIGSGVSKPGGAAY